MTTSAMLGGGLPSPCLEQASMLTKASIGAMERLLPKDGRILPQMPLHDHLMIVYAVFNPCKGAIFSLLFAPFRPAWEAAI